jgi:phosphonopyruvate decarboxylase
MGALAITGNPSPKNFIHIVINNGAHESVGGQPTVGFGIDIPKIALANRYKHALCVQTKAELTNALQNMDNTELPMLIEIKVKQGARADLGRPTIKPVVNKQNFMKKLNE